MKGQTGYRKLLFAPTDKGFGEWCLEIRKSKVFMKMYSLLSDESRLWHLAEYQERKKLLGQLNLIKSQLSDEEDAYLSLILSGKEKLDHRAVGGDRLFEVWKEAEELLISEFRAGSIDIPSFLKRCRESLGMSKAEISVIIGVSAKAYSNYESGRTRITAKDFWVLVCLASGSPTVTFKCIFQVVPMCCFAEGESV